MTVKASAAMAQQQRRSVLADLGEEVTGIVAPVTLCMALTVALVRTLNPEVSTARGAGGGWNN